MRRRTTAPPDDESLPQLPDRALRAEVALKALCADGTLHPDEWFPVSITVKAARREAARAIAVCTACPVRSACLELALRHWTVGQHGIWGGLVPAERAALRRQRLAAAPEYDLAPFMARARTAGSRQRNRAGNPGCRLGIPRTRTRASRTDDAGMETIWHIGIAVPDLEQGKKELGEVFGLSWRPTRVRRLALI